MTGPGRVRILIVTPSYFPAAVAGVSATITPATATAARTSGKKILPICLIFSLLPLLNFHRILLGPRRPLLLICLHGTILLGVGNRCTSGRNWRVFAQIALSFEIGP